MGVQIGWVVVELSYCFWQHVLEHQQSKTETALKSGVLEKGVGAARCAETNELLGVQTGWVVVELSYCFWQHVLEHQQSKTETTPDSNFLEMVDWAAR